MSLTLEIGKILGRKRWVEWLCSSHAGFSQCTIGHWFNKSVLYFPQPGSVSRAGCRRNMSTSQCSILLRNVIFSDANLFHTVSVCLCFFGHFSLPWCPWDSWTHWVSWGPKKKTPTISTTIRLHLLSDDNTDKKPNVDLTDWKAFRWCCRWSLKVPASCMSHIARGSCHGMVLLKLGGSQWWPASLLSFHKSNDYRLTLLWCFGSIPNLRLLMNFG